MNVFVKPDEQSQACLSYGMAESADEAARTEAKIALTMPSRDGRRQTQKEHENERKKQAKSKE